MSRERAAQLIEAGTWLRLSGDLSGARRLFEQALKLDPGNEQARQLLDEREPVPSPAPQPQAAGPETNPFERPQEVDWGLATGYQSPPPFSASAPPGLRPAQAGGEGRAFTPPPIAPAAPPHSTNLFGGPAGARPAPTNLFETSTPPPAAPPPPRSMGPSSLFGPPPDSEPAPRSTVAFGEGPGNLFGPPQSEPAPRTTMAFGGEGPGNLFGPPQGGEPAPRSTMAFGGEGAGEGAGNGSSAPALSPRTTNPFGAAPPAAPQQPEPSTPHSTNLFGAPDVAPSEAAQVHRTNLFGTPAAGTPAQGRSARATMFFGGDASAAPSSLFAPQGDQVAPPRATNLFGAPATGAPAAEPATLPGGTMAFGLPAEPAPRGNAFGPPPTGAPSQRSTLMFQGPTASPPDPRALMPALTPPSPGPPPDPHHALALPKWSTPPAEWSPRSAPQPQPQPGGVPAEWTALAPLSSAQQRTPPPQPRSTAPFGDAPQAPPVSESGLRPAVSQGQAGEAALASAAPPAEIVMSRPAPVAAPASKRGLGPGLSGVWKAVPDAGPSSPAPQPSEEAWSWSASEPPSSADSDPGVVLPAFPSPAPFVSPSPALAMNAESAWDQRSNPGIKLNETESGVAMDMLQADRPSGVREPPPLQGKDQVAALLRGARDLLDLDDHSGAMELIVKAQQVAPDDPEVQLMRDRSEKTLLAMFESKLGDLEGHPRVLLKDDEIIWLNLDHRAGFVLAQIDGGVSFEDVFAVSGMTRIDTARILAQMVDEGVISRG